MASSENEADSQSRLSTSVPQVGQPSTGRSGSGTRERPPTHAAVRSLRADAAERERLLSEARNIDFPSALRGYERSAVDRYVHRVNRLLAELEISSSPEAAIRHALAEASEEAGELRRRGQQAADELIARSRAEADSMLQDAARKAKAILEAAQTEANETREAEQREALKLREMTGGEAKALREIAQHEAAELRGTTAREMAQLREAAVHETQRLRAEAQREAEETGAAARRRSDEMLERADARNRELARSAHAIWLECRRLIEDARLAGEQLTAVAERTRFPRLSDELLLLDDPTSAPTASKTEPTAIPREADGRV